MENNVRKAGGEVGLRINSNVWDSGLIMAPIENPIPDNKQEMGVFLFKSGQDGGIHLMAGNFAKHDTNNNKSTPKNEQGQLGYSELFINYHELRGTADGAWSFCLGNNAHGAYSGKNRIGMDTTSTTYCHEKGIEIFVNDDNAPIMMDGGHAGVAILQNSIAVRSKTGALYGEGDTVRMTGTWATPENQFDIFARFG